jgi:galactokinase
MGERVIAFAPGRVNLIGEHVDYAGGPVLPMAIAQGTTVSGERGGDVIRLTSTVMDGVALVSLEGDETTESRPPAWAAHVAGVVAAMRPERGLVGEVSSDLPVAAGLSSSASLAVALALALGWTGTPQALARLVMDAEARAVGVPCGLMDPLVIVAARPGHALWIDCATGRTEPVPLPDDWCFGLVDTGVRRDLARSEYARRRQEVEAAGRRLGPWQAAVPEDVERLRDPVLARRAQHVITEIARVRKFRLSIEAGDLAAAGALLDESHASLSRDFEVSTSELDSCVQEVRSLTGVVGARLTGAGFGGFVLALARPGTKLPGLTVRPAAGADAL